MSRDTSRARQSTDRDEPDQWLLDAARRAGHRLPDRERPAGTTAWRMLLSAGVPDEEVLRIACDASGTDPADFSQLSPALGDILPHGVALKHRVAPLGIRGGTLSVATSNPRNAVLERDLAFAARQRVRLCAASPTDVIRAQGVVYGTVYGTRGDTIAPATIPLSAPAPAPAAVPQPRPAPVPRLSVPIPMPTEAEIERASDDEVLVAPSTAAADPEPEPEAPRAPVPELADRLLGTACAERASEVILDPTPDGGFLVRFCVDGTLNDRFRIPGAHAARLVQTLRHRAGLDDAPATARPRQGRLTQDTADGAVTVRVSVEAAEDARERLTLRLVSTGALLDLGQLGYAAAEQKRLRALVGETAGLVVVAGPAGAGRTTTLYAAAREAARRGRAVATVEEVVEYPLERVAQTQLAGAKATLASAVRGALSAEGEVLVIGAPLDSAALELCATPAARRRLVLASLDTTDLPATLERLLALQGDRAALAGALRGIVVQRLVRRLCTACAEPQVVEDMPEQQQRLLEGLPTFKLKRPVGCPACRTTGYSGRAALAEVVVTSPELATAITRGVAPPELARLARRSARTTLWDSGIDRVLEGVTSLAELLDCVRPQGVDAAPQPDIDALLTQLLGTPYMTTHDTAAAVAQIGEESDALVVEQSSADETFSLQGSAPQEEAAMVASPAPAPAEAAPVSVPAPAERGALRVLVVDDDATERRALAQALGAEGFQVLQAADGAVALSYVKRLRPDIVLTEVALPGLDAVGLLGALAELASPPPVVVHTEQADDALDAWLHEAGARTVLRRGIAIADLVARLKAETARA